MKGNNDKKPENCCALCNRKVNSVSRHHLVPRQEGGTFGEIVSLCQPCHSTIHYTFSNKELAKDYNSISKLQESDRLSKYLNWIKKRSVERISNKGRK